MYESAILHSTGCKICCYNCARSAISASKSNHDRSSKLSSYSPYLIPDAEPDPYTLDEHIVFASSKLMLLDKLLKKIIAADGRALIFSGFTRMLDTLENHMRLRGIGYARLDGQTSRPRRSLDIRLFQKDDSRALSSLDS